MLDEVTAALAAIETEGTFAAELVCGAEDLQLEVEGVGPIRFPISAAMARKLCAVAQLAPFGRRDKTLLDVRVRNTWEIDSHRIKIDKRTWRRTLEPKLAILRQQLGLPEGGKLEAVLDKMLVYGPGQFFAPHQDSERADDMIGSLVVELPSRHEGGAFVVEHRHEKKVFRGAARGPKALSLLAFYADCHHEVKPVATGFRITLTYHLLYRGTAKEAAIDEPALLRLEESIKAYFSTKIAEPYSTAASQRPDRLIYLLDHEYTQKSLEWDRLKGADRLRVAGLREVAERLDGEVYLAIADVHETWSCEEDWDDGYYGRRGSRWQEDFDEAEDAEGYDLDELIDSDVELRHWLGPDGQVARGIALSPSLDEVCFTRASTEMAPFKSEHEGYMGNYGNTVDRWYHRAAVVMWPRDRSYVVRAKMSPTWAVGELASLIKAGKADEARKRAKELLPFWSFTAPQESSDAFILRLFKVSASLGDPELALKLLSPLGPHRLHARTIPAFVALVERYGTSWAEAVFSAWDGKTRYNALRWLSSLPHLAEALWNGGEQGKSLAAWLLSREVESFKESHKGVLGLPYALAEESEDRRLGDLLSLLETAAVIRAPATRDDVIAFLTAPETALPLMTAGALLEKCREGRTPAAVRALGLRALYLRVVALLERALAAPPRSSDDWSITPPPGCACALCKQLAAFLVAKDRRQFAWPLNKDRRGHIHNVIDRHRLPMTHITIRSGRPQTLMLTKQEELFEREARLRARQKALLAWLKKQRSAFGDAQRPARTPEHRPAA